MLRDPDLEERRVNAAMGFVDHLAPVPLRKSRVRRLARVLLDVSAVVTVFGTIMGYRVVILIGLAGMVGGIAAERVLDSGREA
jgi:hypothetical protein